MHWSMPLLPSWVPNWHYQKYISCGSNRTILETLPIETPTARKARQDRVGDAYYVLSIRQGARTMVVQGRIIGRMESYTLPLRLLGMNEVHFQEARNSTEDESQRFRSVMEHWPRILYFDDFVYRSQESQTTIRSPAGGPPLHRPRRIGRDCLYRNIYRPSATAGDHERAVTCASRRSRMPTLCSVDEPELRLSSRQSRTSSAQVPHQHFQRDWQLLGPRGWSRGKVSLRIC